MGFPRRNRVLSLAEYEACCKWWAAKKRRTLMQIQKWTAWRLAVNCGLRSKEIRLLAIGDVHLDVDRPCVIVHRRNAKNCRNAAYSRCVPLTWSPRAIEDLRTWKEVRTLLHRAKDRDTFLCRLGARAIQGGYLYTPIEHSNLRFWYRYVNAMALGRARAMELSPHTGRHTFITHSLYRGVPPIEVCAAAGHTDLTTTTVYSHLVSDLSNKRTTVFGL